MVVVLQCATVHDRDDYRSVMNALKVMGFSFAHAEALWKVVAAILHLVSVLQHKLMCDMKIMYFTWNSIWLKSDLYFRFCIEDLITPHHWSCSRYLTLYDLCICISHHDFYQSESVFLMQCSIFEDEENCCVVKFSCHLCSLLRSKGQSFRNTFSCIKVTIWLVNIINTEHNKLWGVIRSSLRERK